MSLLDVKIVKSGDLAELRGHVVPSGVAWKID